MSIKDAINRISDSRKDMSLREAVLKFYNTSRKGLGMKGMLAIPVVIIGAIVFYKCCK